MKTGEVSVVIPTYNQSAFLGEAIESVLGQTYPPAEVIVVDDGSTDDTSRVLHRYRDRVRLISQANAGVAAARNRGASGGASPYLAFLDSDDRWWPRKLERQVAALDRRPECVLVHGGVRLISAEGRTLDEVVDGLDGCLRDELLLCRRTVVLGGGSGFMIRRSAFERVGGFDLRLSTSADFDLFVRLAELGPFAFVPEVLLDYRLHGSNMHRNVDAMRSDLVTSGRGAIARRSGRRSYRRRSTVHQQLLLAANYAAAGRRKAASRELLVAGATGPLWLPPVLGRMTRFALGKSILRQGDSTGGTA